MKMSRREFLRTGVGATVAAAQLGRAGFASEDKPSPADSIPKRRLGKTGQMLSVIGFGGMVVKDASPAEAKDRVSMAIERGVNYFDVSPIYGNAQERLGPALEGRRDKVFLACKTGKRTKAEAQRELEESLRLLKTDYLDLYQLHSMTTKEDVETAFGPDGALETFLAARDKGIIRNIGFSAHSNRAAMACMERFDFATILYPVNYALWGNGFSPEVIAKAQSKGMGCLGLKAMAKNVVPRNAPKPFPKCWYVPISDARIIGLALRFALSKELTAVIPSGEESLFFMALSSKDLTKPLDDAEVAELKSAYDDLPPLFNPDEPGASGAPRRRA